MIVDVIVGVVVVRFEVEFLLSFIPHTGPLVVLRVHKYMPQVGHRVERSTLTEMKQLAKQRPRGCICELRKNIRRMRLEIMHCSGSEYRMGQARQYV